MKAMIRCAVLGLGRLGYWHAENLATRVKGAQVVSLVDPLEERAERVARELGVSNWTTNADDVFHDTLVDAVIIATPTSTHADLTARAAQNKKHIFVEKPLTQTVDESDEVVKIIAENKVVCQVGFMRRFDPAYQEAKRRIVAGDIGEPIYLKAISRDPGSPPAEFIKNSGGIFLDMSIHDYDMARYLMGAEVTSVAAHGKILMNPFMEEFNDIDQAITYLNFSSGAAGDIEGSRNAHYGYDIRAEVLGTEGTIVISSLKYHNVQILTPNGCTHDIIPAFPQRFKDAFLLEMIHFIECLRKDEKPSVTEEDGKMALEIAVASKSAFELEKTIYLADPMKV